MKVASTIRFGVAAPHAIGRDHPEGVLAGVHSNYYFTYPSGDRWPLDKAFVQRYYKRWSGPELPIRKVPTQRCIC